MKRKSDCKTKKDEKSGLEKFGESCKKADNKIENVCRKFILGAKS